MWVLFTVCTDVLPPWLPARLFITPPNLHDASTLFMKLRAAKKANGAAGVHRLRSPLSSSSLLRSGIFHLTIMTTTTQQSVTWRRQNSPSEPLGDRHRDRLECLQWAGLFLLSSSSSVAFYFFPCHPLVLANTSHLFLSTLCCLFPSWFCHHTSPVVSKVQPLIDHISLLSLSDPCSCISLSSMSHALHAYMQYQNMHSNKWNIFTQHFNNNKLTIEIRRK